MRCMYRLDCVDDGELDSSIRVIDSAQDCMLGPILGGPYVHSMLGVNVTVAYKCLWCDCNHTRGFPRVGLAQAGKHLGSGCIVRRN